MTDERVHQVLTDSVNYEFNLGMDLIALSILYGVARYSLQCPGLEAFDHAHKLSWLYDDASIFLERKYRKYRQFQRDNDVRSSQYFLPGF